MGIKVQKRKKKSSRGSLYSLNGCGGRGKKASSAFKSELIAAARKGGRRDSCIKGKKGGTRQEQDLKK